ASIVLDGGATVGALVAVNAAGSPADPRTGIPYAAHLGLAGEFPPLRPAQRADLEAAARVAAAAHGEPAAGPGPATPLAVVATDAALTKSQCQRMAGIGHDGFARALKPVHTLFDGDTVFALASGERGAPDLIEATLLMEAGADCIARAIVHAVLAAESVDRSGEGGLLARSWREAFPTAWRPEG
ncbi:MAG: P1 family peptidase, partial [Micrococcales bacterium]|nr:P1 family peptidase [Micrococcales bacterium]